MIQYFIMLICAHMLADFPLQTNWIARQKKRVIVSITHAVIHIATTLAVISLTGWKIPSLTIIAIAVGIGILHSIIDLIKVYCFEDHLNSFLIDQIAHIGVLLPVAFLMQRQSAISYHPVVAHIVIYITGFFVIWNTASHFIDRFVAKYLPSQDKQPKHTISSHNQASDWIGKFERILAFGFILMGYPEGIGFIIAGKSILRFQDAKKEKMSEYILIGTLLSLTIAIGVTYLCRYTTTLFK